MQPAIIYQVAAHVVSSLITRWQHTMPLSHIDVCSLVRSLSKVNYGNLDPLASSVKGKIM